MKPNAPSAHREDGFSLVEMLVTLALLAALSAILLGAVAQFRPLGSLAESANGRMEVAAAAAFLQKTVEDARSLYLLNSPPGQRRAFEGAARSLRFPTVLRVGSDQLALRDIAIVKGESDGSPSVILENRPRRFSSDASASERFSVIDNIEDFSFQFLDSPQVDAGNVSTWLLDWPYPERLPYAVKITLKAKRGRSEISITRIAFPGSSS